MRRVIVILLFIFLFNFISLDSKICKTFDFLGVKYLRGFSFSEDMGQRFKGYQRITYKIFYNGIPSGYIYWSYQGRKSLGDREAEVLKVSSSAEILKLLNLSSNEDVFLDYKTHLPLRVERSVVLFGKKEVIKEIYNQDEGYIKIMRKDGKIKEDILYQEKPIHNILALLYFFPQGIELKRNKWMIFNLPTQKIKMKFIGERVLVRGKDKQDTYFLIGSGMRRFNLWLDKVSRLPLRLEFISFIGKVSIVRTDEPK